MHRVLIVSTMVPQIFEFSLFRPRWSASLSFADGYERLSMMERRIFFSTYTDCPMVEYLSPNGTGLGADCPMVEYLAI